MPDLGKYAVEVQSAYLATIAILLVLIVASWIKSARVKRELEAAEERARNG